MNLCITAVTELGPCEATCGVKNYFKRPFRMKSDLFLLMLMFKMLQQLMALLKRSHLLLLLAWFGSFIKTLYIFPWDLITICNKRENLHSHEQKITGKDIGCHIALYHTVPSSSLPTCWTWLPWICTRTLFLAPGDSLRTQLA